MVIIVSLFISICFLIVLLSGLIKLSTYQLILWLSIYQVDKFPECVCVCVFVLEGGWEEMYIKRTKESGSSRDEQKGTKGGGRGGRGFKQFQI